MQITMVNLDLKGLRCIADLFLLKAYNNHVCLVRGDECVDLRSVLGHLIPARII